ncbi:hypothetical protein SR882_05580 [Guyparkeria halophila]|uniref:Oligosaccharide repeat unit polymerase n=1 Tax=Guyparkeria halophila TaxID=47960 RepID=A0ABZ0YZB8_9GAMM|nr:hypothetical protein [Guyparkeria halophila]WQH17376.1 hypothetical protein SR882_05580 [Guyparkeria halophila]
MQLRGFNLLSFRSFGMRNPVVFIGLQLFLLVALASFVPYLSEHAWFGFAIILVLLGFGFIFSQRLDWVFSPLTFFSVSYLGYAVGAIYYSIAGGVGKFSILTGTEVEFWSYAPSVSLLLVLCFIGFGAGYLFGEFRIHGCRAKPPSREAAAGQKGKWLLSVYKPIVFISLFIGLVWWVYIAYTVSDGLWQFIKEFQVFPHRVAEYGISTLPYHFYYAGIFLWLYVFLLKDESPGVLFWLLSLVGVLINLTQGRVMLSATFLMSLLVALGVFRPVLRARIVYLLLGVVVLAIVAYVLRIYSNYSFIGKEFDLFDGGLVSSVLGSLVAGGNVPDLQQLVIITHGWPHGSGVYGLTYLDGFRNMFSGLFGFEPSSVGLQIKELYFPDRSGPPTPGAVGETYYNFGMFSPLFFVFVGFVLAKIYRHVLASGSALLYIIYAIFLTRFVFMYPKVDSTMIVNFLWGVGPFLFILLVSYLCWGFLRFGREFR